MNTRCVYGAISVLFTQTDPLEATVGLPYPSSYVYGQNNPLVFTDQSGMRSIEGASSSNPVSDLEPTELAFAAGAKGSLAAVPACTGFRLITVGGIFGCKMIRDERGTGLDFSFRVNPILVEEMRSKRSDVTMDRVSYKVFRVLGPDRDRAKEVPALRTTKNGSDIRGELDPLDYEYHSIARAKTVKWQPSEAIRFEVDARFKNAPTLVSLPVGGVPGAFEGFIGGVRNKVTVRPS